MRLILISLAVLAASVKADLDDLSTPELQELLQELDYERDYL